VSVYLYGITTAPGPEAVDEPGVERGEVRAATAGRLSAMVSRVATVPVPAGRENLTAHSKVLESIHARCTVIPARFGTVFPDEQALIAELLDARRSELEQLLNDLEGRSELTVKAFYEQESVLREIVAHEPSIRALRDELRRPGASEPYLANVRLGEMVAAALACKRDADAQRVLAPLRPLAEDVRVGDAAVEGIVVNASFLVERHRLTEFDAAVASLGEELGDRMVMKYVGPLPPYSFADVESDARDAAAPARRP
jgi:Gas vesicle synthesis protein GvpL/GvpF